MTAKGFPAMDLLFEPENQSLKVRQKKSSDPESATLRLLIGPEGASELHLSIF